MEKFEVYPIGKIQADENGIKIVLDKKYLPALADLDGYSHIHVLWWFSRHDNENDRNNMTVRTPHKNAPYPVGTFASRSPMRPNPIALTCSRVLYIDHENAMIDLDQIEAFDGTPVLDIKPYSPSSDRVDNPTVPSWRSHWPNSYEASESFDWDSERREPKRKL